MWPEGNKKVSDQVVRGGFTEETLLNWLLQEDWKLRLSRRGKGDNSRQRTWRKKQKDMVGMGERL